MMIRSIFVIVLTFVALPVLAGGGVVEINQAKALAGGVTPGDSPGFPVTISVAGSYRLVGDLDVSDAGLPSTTRGIEITAADVTLDLGGNAVRGPNTCTGSPVTSCQISGSGAGIWATADNATIRNGFVLGARGVGVRAGDAARIENLHVVESGSDGIIADELSLIRDCSLYRNDGYAIRVRNASIVSGNLIYFNGGVGISVANTLGGINRDDNLAVRIAGNTLRLNGQTGLAFTTTTFPDRNVALYTRNVITTGAGIDPVSPTGVDPQDPVDIGDNLCNGSLNCDGS